MINATDLLTKGKEHLQKEEYAEAITEFKTAWGLLIKTPKNNKTKSFCQSQLAIAYYHQDLLIDNQCIDNVMNAAYWAVKLNNKNALAHYLLGIAWFHLNKIDEAIKETKIASNLDSSNALYKNNLGRFYKQKGDEISANKWFAKAKILDSNLSETSPIFSDVKKTVKPAPKMQVIRKRKVPVMLIFLGFLTCLLIVASLSFFIQMPILMLDDDEYVHFFEKKTYNPNIFLYPAVLPVIGDDCSQLPEIQAISSLSSVIRNTVGEAIILVPSISNWFNMNPKGDENDTQIYQTNLNDFYIITETGEIISEPIGITIRFDGQYRVYYEKTLDFPYQKAEDIKEITLMNVKTGMGIAFTFIPELDGKDPSGYAKFMLKDTLTKKKITYGREYSATDREPLPLNIYETGNHQLILTGNEIKVHILIYGDKIT